MTQRATIGGCTIAIALLTAGCTFFQNDAERGFHQVRHWNSDTEGVIYTTADVRLVTRRKRPNTDEIVTCTEPSPDVAKALSTVSQLTAKGGSGTTTGELDSQLSSTEAVAELAGRSTALLALRDGVFRTCEAYANGVLGADAYALVLARYGQLMTALFLGQDISGAMSPVAASAGASKTPSTSPPSAPVVSVALANPSATGTAGGNGTDGKGNPPASNTPDESTTNDPGASGSPASGADPVRATALARINEDYYDLDQNLAPLLLVACVNHTDPTRSAKDVDGQSGPSWLTTFCNGMSAPAAWMTLAKQAADLEKVTGHPAPVVDLVAVANPGKSNSSSNGNPPSGPHIAPLHAPVHQQKATHPAAASDGNVLVAQAELKAEGYAVAKVNGVLDAKTQSALRHYQANNGLKVTGNADQATLTHLGADQQRLASAATTETTKNEN